MSCANMQSHSQKGVGGCLIEWSLTSLYNIVAFREPLNCCAWWSRRSEWSDCLLRELPSLQESWRSTGHQSSHTQTTGKCGLPLFFLHVCHILGLKNELDEGDRPMMVICSAAHKTKSMYFFLVQSEQGDVFKVTLETDGDIVTEMRIKVCP